MQMTIFMKATILMAMLTIATANTSCDTCKFITTVAEECLIQNKTIMYIENLLDNICGDLPYPFHEPCVDIVNTYLPDAINMLEEYQSPQVICRELKFCPSTIDMDQCSICKYSVGLIEDLVEDSEPEIVSELNKFCEMLSPEYESMCKSIEGNVPKIIDWVTDKENPDTICQQLNMCSA
jgi:hypothetical protein